MAAFARQETDKDAVWVNQVFQKGKSFYEAGDYKSAVREWDSLNPYLEQYPSFKRVIDYLKSQINAPAKPAPDAWSGTPNEVREAFLRGKASYQSNDWDGALAQWGKIRPYLDPESEEAKLIDKLKMERETLRVAGEQSDEAAGQKQAVLLTPPDDLKGLLLEAKRKLEDQISVMNSRRETMEKESVFEQAWVNTTFEKGKSAYATGQYDQAIEEWDKLIFKLGRDPELKADLDELKKSYNRYRETQVGYANAEAAQQTAVRPADDPMRIYFEQVDKELQQKSRELAQQGQQMQASQAEQQRHVQEIFDKGKALYVKGDTAEAMDQWMLLSRYFDNNPALRSAFLSAQATVHSYQQAQQSLKDLPNVEAYKLRLPDGFSDFLDDAAHQLAAKTREAEGKRDATEKAVGAKRAEVMQAFETGKSLYADGKIAEAVAAWRKSLPWVENADSLETQLQSMETSAQALLKETKALREAEQRAAEPFTAPADFDKQLTEVSQSIKNETQAAANSRLSLQKNAGERSATAKSLLHKANFAYQAGKLDEAIESWKKLIPYLDPLSEDKILIETVAENRGEYLKAKSQLDDLNARKEDKVRLPDDIKAALNRMNADLIKQTDTAAADRLALESKMSAAETEAQSAFEKGRMSFQAGRLPDALAEWKKLRGRWTGQAQDDMLIDDLAQNHAAFQEARQKLSEVQARKAEKVAMPAELKAELVRTNGDLIKQADAAVTERQTLEARMTTEETQAQSAFERGRMSYQAGRLQEALAEWKKLKGQWANAAQDEALIDNLVQNEAGSRDAKARLTEAKSRKVSKIEISAELKADLERANKELLKQIDEAVEARHAIEERISAAEVQAQSAFEKGKMSFQGGRIKDALAEWRVLGPSLDESSGIPGLLRQLEGRLKDREDAQASLDRAAAKKDAKLAPPPDLKGLIQSGIDTTDTEIRALEKRQSDMQTEIQERDAFVSAAFEEGKKLAAEGKVREALYAWERLKGAVEESSGIVPALDALKKSLDALDETRKSNADFTANRYQNLKTPFTEELVKLLTGMDSGFHSDLAKAQADRASMEKALAEKEAWINSTFEKGKAYYEVGKYKEAIEFWSSLQPHLKDEVKIGSLLAGLSDRYQAAVAAQKAAAEAAAKNDERFDTPAALETMLTGMEEKLKTMQFDADSQKAHADQVYRDRSAALAASFEKGRELYEAGDIEGALKEWAAIPGYVQDEARAKALIDNISQSWKSLTAAKQAAAEAQAHQDARFTTPEGLPDLLLDAARKLDKESLATDLQRQTLEKAVTAKEDTVKAVYNEGKAFYDQGKMNEAFLRWRSLLPQMTDEKELGEQLTKAEQSYQRYVNAKQQNQQMIAKKEAKVAAPAELSSILDTVNRQLGDQIFDMKNRASQTEKMLDDRKSWVEVTFQKGKLAYNQGRFRDAVSEWNTLLPFIENGDTLKGQLADFERNLQVSLDSSKIVEEANLKKEAKFQAPEELGVLLTQLNDKVKDEALEASAEKIKAEQSFSERQKWLTATFDAGKAFYQEGKTGEAIAEWTKLGPYLDEKSGMQKLLDAVKENYQAATVAKKGAVEATASDYQGLKLPYAEQMSKLLSEANAKLAGEADGYRAKQKEVENTMAERQEWSLTTFNKGKVFYDQEQYDEALNQWERLLPYLAEGSALKKQIESLRQNYNTVLSGRNELGPAAGEKPVKLKDETALLSVLEEANSKLRTQAEEAHARAAAAEKEITDRQQWIEYTFQKGKAFYDQGNYQKAVDEWAILGPYLTEHPKVRAAIEEARKNYSEGKMAEKAIANIEAKKAALMPLPQSAPAAAPPVPAEEAAPAPAPEASAPAAPAASTAPVEGAAARVPDVAAAQAAGAQLVSGEIVSIDASQRTLALKLYSESGSDETLTLSFDESTQIDGSDAKAISSIQSGSNVDLRYNPQTSRALYIYVY